jgi:hypothetical protein
MLKPNGYQQLVDRYGQPWLSNNQKQMFEDRWMTLWAYRGFQTRMNIEWPKDMSFGGIWCNKEIVPLLDASFKALIEQNLIHEIITYDGCWDVRMKRGQPDKPSVHSWGIAIDLNAGAMPFPCDDPIWSQQFLMCMERCGWTLGASFRDPQHFQACDGY